MSMLKKRLAAERAAGKPATKPVKPAVKAPPVTQAQVELPKKSVDDLMAKMRKATAEKQARDKEIEKDKAAKRAMAQIKGE